MTPYQKRMKESKDRQAKIRKLAESTYKAGQDRHYTYTLDQIATKVGVSRAYVHQIAGGRPPIAERAKP